jgi:lipopolysaccharide transport protein LptA
MKKIFLLWSVVFAVALALPAQVLPPDKNGVARKPTTIESDRAEFDLNTRRAVYLGHVKVDDPEMKLQCEQLTVDLPADGDRVNHIVAEVNVIIDFSDSHGQTARATGSRAVYHYAVTGVVTNESVTLTGNPKVDSPQGTLTGDEIAWDRATGHMTATNQKMIFKQNLNGNADTNTPAVKLF